MSAILQHILYALRGWRRQPAFVAIAVVTLALGVGVNMVVFSLVEALALAGVLTFAITALAAAGPAARALATAPASALRE